MTMTMAFDNNDDEPYDRAGHISIYKRRPGPGALVGPPPASMVRAALRFGLQFAYAFG